MNVDKKVLEKAIELQSNEMTKAKMVADNILDLCNSVATSANSDYERKAELLSKLMPAASHAYAIEHGIHENWQKLMDMQFRVYLSEAEVRKSNQEGTEE